MAKTKPQENLELDLNSYELRRGGRAVPLERQPMELLILLAERAGQLVTREEIELRLWGAGGAVGAEPIINNCIHKLRLALGANGKSPLIQTVFRKGYRLVHPVKVIARTTPASQKATNSAASVDANSSNSMAVLPFNVLGETPRHEYSLGFTDALITALGNLEDFYVLPTAAVLKLPGDTDPTLASSRLGVRYVLQGTIRVQNTKQRVSLQLFDASTRRVAFAQQFDHDLDNMLQAQDTIAHEVAGSLERKIRGSRSTSHERYSKDRIAYAEFMEGYRHSSASEARHYDVAIAHLENAIARDSRFALAHGVLSLVYARKYYEFEPTHIYLEKAEQHVARALQLDPELGEAHLAQAFIVWGPARNFQHIEAIKSLKKALELQPNLRHAHNRLGSILAHVGLLDAARQMYERGRYFEPGQAISHGVSQTYIFNGDYELADRQIRAWRRDSPASIYPLWLEPLSALLQGDLDRAQRELEEALRVLPNEPLITSLQGMLWAQLGEGDRALQCAQSAREYPGSFGHAHHTHHQLACIYSILGQTRTGFEWLDRAVHNGFACWPYFLQAPFLSNLREMPEFVSLIDLLRSKYTEALLA